MCVSIVAQGQPKRQYRLQEDASMAARAAAVKRQFGALALEATRKGRHDRRLQCFHTENCAAAGTKKVSMTVRLVVRCAEAPDTIAAGYAMRQGVRDQPVERAVERHPVVLDARRGKRRRDFVMRQRMARASEHVKYGDTCPRRPSATLGNTRGAGTGKRVGRRWE